MTAMTDRWTGRTGFIVANVGAAVGIGSIWKFPYEVGSNGGGWFVLFYLMGLALVVTPLMLAELAIGRQGRGDALRSMAAVATESRASPRWALIAIFGAIAGFLILSFYSVIGGWTIAYAVDTARNGLPMDGSSAQGRYDDLLASPVSMTLYHALFMLAAAVVVSRGIARGIEAACMILMPVLILLLVALAAYAIAHGDVAATVRFLFSLDPAKFKPVAAVNAIGLGFFSIGIGFALMVTYAAYADRHVSLVEVTAITLIGDTAISFLAGFAVFPIVFDNLLDPASGPGLMFVTLPLAFAGMPAGNLASFAFYVLLFAAALASAISLLELTVAPLVGRGWPRVMAAGLSASSAWGLGIVTILSFNRWSQWRPLAIVNGLSGSNWFEALDYITSNLMLPISGVAFAVFAGWIVPDRVLAQALDMSSAAVNTVRWLLRYVVPLTIGLVTLASALG